MGQEQSEINTLVLIPEVSERTYSCRSLDAESQERLAEWIAHNHIPDPVSKDMLHCSVVCAMSDLPINYIPDRRKVYVNPGTYKLGVIGPAFALFFESYAFEHQWGMACKCGVKMRYEQFIPHISLSYVVLPNWNYTELVPPTFTLSFDAEVVSGYDPQRAKHNWNSVV